MSYFTIPNTGSIEEYDDSGNLIKMTNQCLWISIRDYLAYCLGRQYSIVQIKNMAGLNRDTDYEMADWDNPIFRRAIERIARVLNIQINFYHMYLDGRQIEEATHSVNEGRGNIVNIAFYGAHFEYIVAGPNIAGCQPHMNAPNVEIREYEPKINKNGDFVNIDSEDEFAQMYMIIIDNMDKINNNNILMQKLDRECKDLIDAINRIEQNRELSQREKEMIAADDKQLCVAKLDEYERLKQENIELKETNAMLSEAIDQ